MLHKILIFNLNVQFTLPVNNHWYTFPAALGGLQCFEHEGATQLQAAKNSAENHRNYESFTHTLSYKTFSLCA